MSSLVVCIIVELTMGEMGICFRQSWSGFEGVKVWKSCLLWMVWCGSVQLGKHLFNFVSFQREQCLWPWFWCLI